MSTEEARRGAIVTIGTEIVSGRLVDTNTAEVALALARGDIRVAEAVSVPDDVEAIEAVLRRLIEETDVVVVTGGLGPTHDDVTRQAAARALGRALVRDALIEERLRPWAARNADPRAAEQVFAQAQVIEGARVLPAVEGTAPGLVIPTERGMLALLPGPPREMRPLLEQLAAEWGERAAHPVILRCAGMGESDVQVLAQDALCGRPDVALTVLASPGEVQVVLFDRGAGEAVLAEVAGSVAEHIGPACYSKGETLAETVLAMARSREESLATAESCTGGLVAAALTDVPGSSDVFAGGVVAYSNLLKLSLLDVAPTLITEHGAVSEQVAAAMAEGARDRLGADHAVSVTGIAGPGGGTPEKPVGTVCFAVASREATITANRVFPGSRDVVRRRATVIALDLLRRTLGEV